MTGHVPLRGYQREWLRPDVIAGLTAAAVVIPKAMAFATIAGLPVQVGLYTALVPMVVYALLGTSRPLSVSTTTTIAILTGSALGTVAQGRRGRSAGRRSNACGDGRGGAARGPGAAIRFRREFHLGTRAGRVQVGHRVRDRRRPVAETARRTHRKDRLFPRHFRDPRAPAADVPRYARRLGGDRRADLRAGTSRAAHTRATRRRGSGHRSFRAARPARARSGHRGSGADGAAPSHVAESRHWSMRCGRRRSASH